MSVILSSLLLVALPFQFILPLGTTWDMPIARALAAGVIITFLIEECVQRKFSLKMPESAVLLSFLLWSLASLLWASRLDLALPKIAFLLNILPLFFVWQRHVVFSEQRERYIRFFLWGATASAIVGIAIFLAQFIFGVSETFHFLLGDILPVFLGRELTQMVMQYPSLLVNINGDTWLRATAFFPDPHVASFFFGISGFLALGFSKMSGNRRYLMAAAVLFLADLLTFSRGGYVGLIVGFLGYIILNRGASWPEMRLYLARSFMILGILLFIFGPSIFSRFATSFTLGDASSTERLVLWSSALDTLKEQPIFGTGLGNYLALSQPLASATTPFYAHNLFFDIALETGLAGAALFFALFGIIFWQLWKIRRSHSFVPGVGAAVLLYLTHSIFETALFSVHVSILLAFLLALSSRVGQPDLLQSEHDTTH